jgi:hypothetical protein
VFEGNAAADITKNVSLNSLLDDQLTPPARRGNAVAWLGESVAIKDPTSVSFRRQAGDNLLILGQDPTMADSVMSSTLLSLAAHYAPDGRTAARFHVLDDSPGGAGKTSALAGVCDALPQRPETGGRSDAGRVVTLLAREVDRRLDTDPSESPDVFLFVHNLSWFRDLRHTDNFEFDPRNSSVPASAFAKVLREGPAIGIHVIIWCTNMNTLNRTLDHASRREFAAKVAFQMGSGDSTNFLDSPLAGRLGPHMALAFDEEQGRIEKFRPYGPAPAEWLRWVSESLLRRRVDVDSTMQSPPEKRRRQGGSWSVTATPGWLENSD